MARVLVLGGGFGGLAAATRLRQRLPHDVQVELVDRAGEFVMGLRKTWAIIGTAPLEAGRRRLGDLRKQGIEVRQGTIEAVDPAARRARVDGHWLEADALVLALGAEQVPQAIPGLVEHGLNVWDRGSAKRAGEALAALTDGRLLIGVFGVPYACPPGPFELALLARDRLQARGVAATVEVFGPMPIALPVVGAVESAKIEDLLDRAGIAWLPGRRATRVEQGRVLFEGGDERPFDLLFGVPPHRCPQLLVDAGLAEPGGWVKVNPATLATPFGRVYAVGDSTVIMLAHGLPLPKAGVFAEAQGYVVAERIADELAGRTPIAAFGGEGACYAEVGAGRAVEVRGRFLADPPAVTISAPSREAIAAKAAFESERLRAWFGA